MNRKHFLTDLKIQLKPLTENQRQLILDRYNLKFDSGLAEGKTEEQVAKELGKPKWIAQHILDELNIERIQSTQTYGEWQEFTNYREDVPYNPMYEPYYERRTVSPIARLFQALGLLIFNGLFMIWMIFAGIMMFFAFWFTSLMFTLSPLLVIFASLVQGGGYAPLQFSFSILLCGIGIIGLLILVPVSKFAGKLLFRYLRWCWYILIGEPYYEKN